MNLEEALINDLEIRRHKLQDVMQQMNVEACILTTAVNVFYMTGKVYNGYLYIPAEGNPIHFVKRPEGISFENTIYIRKPEQITEELQNLGITLPKTIMLETDIVSFGECARLLKTFNIIEAANASVLMRKIRSVKTLFEIEQIRLCARRHETVYKLIPSLWQEGMTDIEFQIEIERVMRLHGSL